MLSAQKNKFIKMNACGNDFIIAFFYDETVAKLLFSTILALSKFVRELLDLLGLPSHKFRCLKIVRKNLVLRQSHDKNLIAKISDRKNVGCDQFIVLKNSVNADIFMEIYNADGSRSAVCGNATRCVASLFEKEFVRIETDAGILNCLRTAPDLIEVEMPKAEFLENFVYKEFLFYNIDLGNPHAVCFLEKNLTDENFFKIGSLIENNKFYKNKTNVEFAKIIDEKTIEVRVFERGVGETLSCGSGACAVAAAAFKNNFIKKNDIDIIFKGGKLNIKYFDDKILMTGGYQKIFDGIFDENFIKFQSR